MPLEALEAFVPEPLVMRDPVPHRTELLGGEAVAALPTVPLFGDQAGVEEDAQVLGDRRAAHLEVRRDRIDRAVAIGEQVEYPAPGRMADRSEDFGRSEEHTSELQSRPH